jgi:DNA (cytosine-5)-methyltransferase 1
MSASSQVNTPIGLSAQATDSNWSELSAPLSLPKGGQGAGTADSGAWTSGALFAGYGGLDLAVEEVLGARTAWVADVDPGASAILARRFPDAPNLGDVTTVDWHAAGRVDVITGGTPCQDVSHAGKRAGMRPGTRSGLWAAMADAIEIIRPRFVVWENVRGALSARADSAVEPCPFCVGDDPGVTLRALGRVLGDLAELGYDAAWCGLRAADVGAPHQRYRVFVLAWDADTSSAGLEAWRQGRAGGARDVAGRALAGDRDAGPVQRQGRRPARPPPPAGARGRAPPRRSGDSVRRRAASARPDPRRCAGRRSR